MLIDEFYFGKFRRGRIRDSPPARLVEAKTLSLQIVARYMNMRRLHGLHDCKSETDRG